ncbi:MAG: RnfABCDGE type electron transport complex subunit G [bacterium]
MGEIPRLVFVLTSITVVAGLALAGVYNLTKGKIEEAFYQERLKAIKVVLPEYDNDPVNDTREVAFVNAKGEEEKRTIYIGRKGDKIVAVAFESTASGGYGGNITIMLGATPEGVLTGIEILKHLETPGLGARITESSFKGQFKGLSLRDDLRVKKDGGVVDQISGATISPRTVVKAVKQGLELWDTVKSQVGF